MEENNSNSNTMELVTAVGSVSDDAKILQSLNLNLQVRVYNLDNENTRLKDELQKYKGKAFIYESITKDLATLRTQFDKTAAALLRKCEAYDALKKDYNALKARNNKSPRSNMRSPNSRESQSQVSNFQKKLVLYEAMDYTSDVDCYGDKARRPSMGSCGNLTRPQIYSEEVQADNFGCPPAAPLRNRLLIKLHSLKAASTESLESTGRRSIRSQEVQVKTDKATISSSRRIISVKAKLDVPAQPTKSAMKAPPSIRPALGQSNGQQRLVKMTNVSSIKRSNSSSSSKSATAKPAFRV
ncbi:hypothetical protein Ocin01_10857 [Orchesella cincta]|uniref:Uncharacterized protein n=1 Tax=Orchesella cincta TaxID=48709 RepID=A0A1D2MS49_ORCCI|nr:hypothetical protein Ocin01_10857 [Orchesella cincta]